MERFFDKTILYDKDISYIACTYKHLHIVKYLIQSNYGRAHDLAARQARARGLRPQNAALGRCGDGLDAGANRRRRGAGAVH